MLLDVFKSSEEEEVYLFSRTFGTICMERASQIMVGAMALAWRHSVPRLFVELDGFTKYMGGDFKVELKEDKGKIVYE